MTVAQRIYAMEAQLALGRKSDVRYEYWDGEVYAMSGGTLWLSFNASWA